MTITSVYSDVQKSFILCSWPIHTKIHRKHGIYKKWRRRPWSVQGPRLQTCQPSKGPLAKRKLTMFPEKNLSHVSALHWLPRESKVSSIFKKPFSQSILEWHSCTVQSLQADTTELFTILPHQSQTSPQIRRSDDWFNKLLTGLLIWHVVL